MFYKTRGIVLNNTNYNDKYSIAKIYTETFGMSSYMLSSAKGRKANLMRPIFRMPAILDLDVEHLNLREINRIRDARVNEVFTSISVHPVKGALYMFLSEFLLNVIKEIQANGNLFQYLSESLKILDCSEKGIANFHIVFMIGISRFLGFYPNTDNFKRGSRFDLSNGIFIPSGSDSGEILDREESEVCFLLTKMNYSNMHRYKFSGKNRLEIIKQILHYYRIHLYNFPELKSLDILENIFE